MKLFFALVPFLACKELKTECEACKDLQKAIQTNLEKTRKQNFGGGNTKWEEKSLGAWETSETRLIQVVDFACKGDFKCSSFVETYEEEIEDWWKSGPDSGENARPDFFAELCVKTGKACCADETKYGRECKDCPKGKNGKICSGTGTCIGAGDRRGKGGCKCNHSIKGDLCDQCDLKNTFVETEVSETENVKCGRCNTACKLGCSGPKDHQCKDNICAAKFILADEKVKDEEGLETGETIKRCVRLPTKPGNSILEKKEDDEEKDPVRTDDYNEPVVSRNENEDLQESQNPVLDKVSDEIVQSTETEPEEPVLEMPKIDERFTKSAFEAVDHDEF